MAVINFLEFLCYLYVQCMSLLHIFMVITGKFGVKIDRATPMVARQLCKSVLQDIETTERFRRDFPNRVTSLFYEDLARRPLEIAANLYKRYTLFLDTETMYHLYMMTNDKLTNPCGNVTGLCLRSHNSSGHIHTWKRYLKTNVINIIDNICQPLYQKTNNFYKSVNT